jgi:hypothetical protein
MVAVVGHVRMLSIGVTAVRPTARMLGTPSAHQALRLDTQILFDCNSSLRRLFADATHSLGQCILALSIGGH